MITIKTAQEYVDFALFVVENDYETFYAGTHNQQADDIICLAVMDGGVTVETYVSTIPAMVDVVRSFHNLQSFLNHGIVR